MAYNLSCGGAGDDKLEIVVGKVVGAGGDMGEIFPNIGRLICIQGYRGDVERGVSVGLAGETVAAGTQGGRCRTAGDVSEIITATKCVLGNPGDTGRDDDFLQRKASAKGAIIDVLDAFGDVHLAQIVTVIESIIADAADCRWKLHAI